MSSDQIMILVKTFCTVSLLYHASEDAMVSIASRFLLVYLLVLCHLVLNLEFFFFVDWFAYLPREFSFPYFLTLVGVWGKMDSCYYQRHYCVMKFRQPHP